MPSERHFNRYNPADFSYRRDIAPAAVRHELHFRVPPNSILIYVKASPLFLTPIALMYSSAVMGFGDRKIADLAGGTDGADEGVIKRCIIFVLAKAA